MCISAQWHTGKEKSSPMILIVVMGRRKEWAVWVVRGAFSEMQTIKWGLKGRAGGNRGRSHQASGKVRERWAQALAWVVGRASWRKTLQVMVRFLNFIWKTMESHWRVFNGAREVVEGRTWEYNQRGFPHQLMPWLDPSFFNPKQNGGCAAVQSLPHLLPTKEGIFRSVYRGRVAGAPWATKLSLHDKGPCNWVLNILLLVQNWNRKGKGNFFHFYKSSSSSFTTCRKLDDHQNIFCVCLMSTNTAFHQPHPQWNCIFSNTLFFWVWALFSTFSFYLTLNNSSWICWRAKHIWYVRISSLSND